MKQDRSTSIFPIRSKKNTTIANYLHLVLWDAYHDLVNPYNETVSRIMSDVFTKAKP